MWRMDVPGLPGWNTVSDLRRANQRIARLEKEKLLLLIALKLRNTGPDSKGYHDNDVARWFDPGKPYAKLPTGNETVKDYDAALRPFKERVRKIAKEAER